MANDFQPIRLAIADYMRGFYSFLLADTPALEEFKARGLERCIQWAPDRMVDAVEEMLDAYRKNENEGVAGQRSLFPIIVIALARDYTPAGGDWGRQLGDRIMVAFDDAPGSSVYGYRQAQGDIRLQIAVIASDSATARSIASQFAVWCGAMPNRYMAPKYQFGQYQFDMPLMLESPDIIFMNVATDSKNTTILAGDLTLRITIPHFDAPKAGDPNDGTTNVPPGYPVNGGVNVVGFDPATYTP